MNILTFSSIASGNMIYNSFSANSIRNFGDSLFSYFAKCSEADFITGKFHRWKGGHDLILDIIPTFSNHGYSAGIKQTGHILLTDFITKDGIPIPLFSQNGLGGLITETFGISRKWLNLNIIGSITGGISFIEGGMDFLSALTGAVKMNRYVFLDTFGEGATELVFATVTQNPLFLIGAVENILSGIIITWNTYTYYIDPLVFLGSGLISGVISGTLTFLISKEKDIKTKIKNTCKTALKTGIVSAVYTVNTLFGIGSLFGILAAQYGKILADSTNKNLEKTITGNQTSYNIIDEEYEKLISSFPTFHKKLNKLNHLEESYLTFSEKTAFSPEEICFNDKYTFNVPEIYFNI